MNPEPPITNNSFAAVLNLHRKGSLLADLSAHMQSLVQAVREHGADGTLTLKLKVSPASGDGSMLSIHDEITAKLPQPKKANTLFFATDDNRLVRNDPNQKEMDLRTVPVPVASEVKVLNQQQSA